MFTLNETIYSTEKLQITVTNSLTMCGPEKIL